MYIYIHRKPPHGCRNQNQSGDQAGKCAREPLCVGVGVGVGVSVQDYQSMLTPGRVEDT